MLQSESTILIKTSKKYYLTTDLVILRTPAKSRISLKRFNTNKILPRNEYFIRQLRDRSFLFPFFLQAFGINNNFKKV